MALVLADRVLETTTTAGSGTITLAGAEPGYQSFSAVGDGNQTYYTIAGDTEWEVGIGTYTASGTTLSRDTVLSSSNSNAKVTFSAGTKKVFVTYPSEKSVNLDVSGNISLSSAVISGVASPSADSDAATKLYVDTLAAQGITYHAPVKYEVPNTTGNLTATYNNGTAGVGATLTNAGTLVAFVPDGVTASISDRVLVYNQTNGFENGVYTVTVVGNGATSWVLTRATDADTYALKSPNSLGGGDAFYVTSGNTGAGETYLCNNSGTIVFGSTAISFVQISAAQVYSAGNGLSLTNTVFSLATPVAVGNGGTGSSAAPGNGELLIGNGSGYTLATLTAGSGVSITNSAGSITLSATGLGGTVTAVTATGPLASSGGTTPDISIANSTGTGSVVLDQGATISSATITAALSASITTITGTSANITTVTGTTAGFSSAAITQLSGTSAGITTVSGTTTTFSSGTITQFGATSATIATVSGTNVTYSNGNFTSATVTTVSGTNINYGSLTLSGGANITGNVGIGGSPTQKLSVIGGRSRLQANNETYSLQLEYGSGTGQYYIGATNSATPDLVFSNVSGTERMRLDTSGNLGLATATVSTNFRQEIVGAAGSNTGPASSGTTQNASAVMRIRPGGGFTATLDIGQGGGTGSWLQSTDTSNLATTYPLLLNPVGGNVGIGTASPASLLDLTGNDPTLRLTDNAGSPTRTYSMRSADGNYLIRDVTGGSDRFVIDSTGRVGIGTNSPAVTLQATNTSGEVFRLTNTTASERLHFYTRNATGTSRIESQNSDLQLFAYDSNILTFGTANTERFRIGTSGQLGIGGANYGTSGQVLTSNGSGSAPSWQTAGGSSLKSQTFTSSGTFTVPTGVTSVWVTMTGGGGSGGAGTSFGIGPGGGAGAYTIKRAISVTAGASITVTIGGGGAGVAAGLAATTDGGRGGTTSFGSTSVTGGYGGRSAATGYAGMGGANGGTGFGPNPARLPGSVGGTPGLSLGQLSGNNAIWGGAGGLFGDGTDGPAVNNASTSAAANTGAGSGGSGNNGSTTSATGNGGSGMVIVEWLG